jgi:hypothetical protein
MVITVVLRIIWYFNGCQLISGIGSTYRAADGAQALNHYSAGDTLGDFGSCKNSIILLKQISLAFGADIWSNGNQSGGELNALWTC